MLYIGWQLISSEKIRKKVNFVKYKIRLLTLFKLHPETSTMEKVTTTAEAEINFKRLRR